MWDKDDDGGSMNHGIGVADQVHGLGLQRGGPNNQGNGVFLGLGS